VEEKSPNKSRRCSRVKGEGNLLGLAYSHRVGKAAGKGNLGPTILRDSNPLTQIHSTRRSRMLEQARHYPSTINHHRKLSPLSMIGRHGHSSPDSQEPGRFDSLPLFTSSFDVSFPSSASLIRLDLVSTLSSPLSLPKIPRNPQLVNNTSQQPSSASLYHPLLPPLFLHLLPPLLHLTHRPSLDKSEHLD